ncbi:MAG: cell division protein ZapA [Mangrovibacterium sp.]
MMTTDRKINITIGIAGKRYPLTISASEEETYRKAEKQVSESLKKSSGKNFEGLLQQDYLALVAFQFALAYLKIKHKQDVSDFVQQVELLNDELSDYLSKN